MTDGNEELLVGYIWHIGCSSKWVCCFISPCCCLFLGCKFVGLMFISVGLILISGSCSSFPGFGVAHERGGIWVISSGVSGFHLSTTQLSCA